MIKLIECPRDAMQGLSQFVPTKIKIDYINQLLNVGFDSLDCASFVSPKAIPQMRDSAEVISNLDLSNTKTKLLVIVANKRGALEACNFEQISYLGYPFSISETFQLRNTNAGINESLERARTIQEICVKNNKSMVAYLSMGFGNPYGDEWNLEIVEKWVSKLVELDIKTISISDTIGIANPEKIELIFKNLIEKYKHIEFGAHFHSLPEASIEKIEAAYKSGCTRFDAALKGFGGCPMAKDDLTGNIATETLIEYLISKNEAINLDFKNLNSSIDFALNKVFPIKTSHS
jgi:hydroxymethylglutaryl-CoA lyase